MMEENQPNKLSFIVICGFIICLISSCNTKTQKEDSITFTFNRYNSNDSIIEKNVFELKKYISKATDSILVYSEGKLYCGYKEKFVQDKGIYRLCDKELKLTHSFSDTINSLELCGYKKPFLNQYVLLLGIKNYNLQGKEYRLYHYAERNNNQSSYDSYYLEGMGFICYYNFDRDDYILSDSITINSIDVRKITSLLVKDTSFFGRYTIAKIFPNYYRAKQP